MTKIKCITIDCNKKTYTYEIGKNNVETIELDTENELIIIHYSNSSDQKYLKIPIETIDFYNYER